MASLPEYVAADAFLVKDTDTITMGQEPIITTPHAIEGVLKNPQTTGYLMHGWYTINPCS